MTIYYRDEIGEIAVEINSEYGVNFCDGYAYFNDIENVDYRIKTDHIIEITEK